ncbi:hypothetical protein L484_002620 [Morus notabilis]|uniref:Uncharacterized protein n=1 Tax=Morus notabilis TaxID=981085 RepID=W9RBE2_9ROSA|nr:hypothetical protein L484_002620 [Morus notabilis]
MVSWSIWLARNSFVFEGIQHACNNCAEQAGHLLGEFQCCNVDVVDFPREVVTRAVDG